MPLTTGQGTELELGNDGERILSKDLKLSNNNLDHRVCICNSRYSSGNAPSGKCNACAVYSNTITDYRIPDFYTEKFIAESKNAVYFPSDTIQVDDFTFMANTLQVPLWIFVRQNTKINPVYQTKVAATGGGVVPYFTVPGFIDPVDQIAGYGLVAGEVGILAVLLLQIADRRQKRSTTPVSTGDTPRRPAPRPGQPESPLEQAQRKLDALDDFTDRSTDRTREDIDTEDSRE